MPEFHFLEEPPQERIEELLKIIEETEIKPRLIFPFILNKERGEAMKMIMSKETNLERILEFLKNEDFVIREAGLYLLRQIPKFSDKDLEIILPILERMSDEGDTTFKEALIKTLSHLGKKALPILEKMKENLAVKDKVILALGRIGRIEGKALQIILEEMRKSREIWIKIAVARALGFVGEKGLSHLKAIIETEEILAVKEAAIKSLGMIGGKEALEILRKMRKSEDEEIRAVVAETLGFFGKEAFEILEEMRKDENWHIREKVARALGQIGGNEALEILRKMSEDKEPLVRVEVAKSLSKIGNEESLQILEKLKKDEFLAVQQTAKICLDSFKVRTWLLATRKPLFATPETKDLIEKIRKLERISERLKKEFGDDFVGIIIFGSTAKGYRLEESDIDWGIIAKNEKVPERFREIATQESLNLCFQRFIKVNENYQVVEDHESLLFLGSGLFFGDWKKLYQIQKTALENMSKEDWEMIRQLIRDYETNLRKVKERFNLPDEKIEEMQIVISLLRVPLSLKESLEIAERRYERFVERKNQ